MWESFSLAYRDWARSARESVARSPPSTKPRQRRSHSRGSSPSGPGIVPIPGTRRLERLQENTGAESISLTGEQLARLDAATTIIRGARGNGREFYG